MKAMILSLVFAASVAHGAISSIEISAGDTAPLGAGRVMAVQAMTTQSDADMTVKRVTPFEVESLSTVTVTNFTYRPATSNILYTATETLWSAYTTNAYAVATGSVVAVTFVTNVSTVVTGTVWSASTGLSNLTHTVTNVVALTNAVPLVRTGITSNLLAQAWGTKPFVAGWPTNELLYTSQSVSRTLSSNLTYQVVDTVEVRTNRVRSVRRTAFTNTLWNAEVDGYKTNLLDAVIFPGDYLVGEGIGFSEGKVLLLIER